MKHLYNPIPLGRIRGGIDSVKSFWKEESIDEYNDETKTYHTNIYGCLLESSLYSAKR